MARRLAKAGFIVLAPDGLGAVGGYPGNDEKGRELQQSVDPEKLMNDFFAAIGYLMASDLTTGKVGIVGFCYGGGGSLLRAAGAGGGRAEHQRAAASAPCRAGHARERGLARL